MSNINNAIWKALDATGLSKLAIRTRSWGRSNGLLKWEPLVPPDAFLRTCHLAIDTLKARGHVFYDYLEFGVSRGASMACMSRALKESGGLGAMRLFGFDSFEGMPKESKDQGWDPGDFRSTLRDTTAYLRSQGADLDRIELVKGWVKDTCTLETAKRLGIQKASIVMVDCDIYSASCEALAFVAPMIVDEAVVIFDDWGWMEDQKMVGQKEAWAEFLAANPSLAATPLEPVYRPEARMFLLTRR